MVDDCNRAQAVELIRALHSQLREMTARLAGLQSQGGSDTNGRASETQGDALALRRDIAEAQAHIDRLQQRYLASPAGALTQV